MASKMSGKAKTAASTPWLRIGVTGGLACGKSLVASFLAARGIAVIEADQVCHDLLRPGTPLFEKVVAVFGRAILAGDGAINRAALGKRVFGFSAARRRLNELIHPAAIEAISAWVQARRQEALRGRSPFWRGGAVAVIPLLYEVGWETAWDSVICVGAPVGLQRERLRTKGFSEREIDNRLSAQWPAEEKMKRADYVIFNAGTVACAQQQTVQLMQQFEKHPGEQQWKINAT